MNTNHTSATFDKNREGTYKPKVTPEHLRKLWLIKQQTRKPITELVSEALELYFERQGKGVKK